MEITLRILLISFYFPPDLSAGSFRAEALVTALRERGPSSLHVDVITTFPNRYGSLKGVADTEELCDNIRITRLNIPPHNIGMLDQAKSFASFALQVLSKTKNEKWDIVIGTSSRLMTATLSIVVAYRAGAAVYLDIRDLFTDTMGDVLSKSPMKILVPFFRMIEQQVFRRASRLNVVSGGFLPYIKRVAPRQNCSVFTNGIDDDFLKARPIQPARTNCSECVVLYAGNMGDGQGLHNVVPAAAAMLERDVHFRLIGDGGKRAQLELSVLAGNLDNVEIMKPVPRNLLCAHYDAADILFLHLNDLDAFKKVLPSKLFEYAATGKPILAGVSGYAARFIESEIIGASVFSPCDSFGLVEALQRLREGPSHFDRNAFREKYCRRTIMNRMADDVLTLAPDKLKIS